MDIENQQLDANPLATEGEDANTTGEPSVAETSTVGDESQFKGNELEDADFSFEATIDVANWNGLSGIKELNNVCEDLHRKAEGEESKLWSDSTDSSIKSRNASTTGRQLPSGLNQASFINSLSCSAESSQKQAAKTPSGK